MKLRLRLPQTGKDHSTKENIVHLARETENAGLDSFVGFREVLSEGRAIAGRYWMVKRRVRVSGIPFKDRGKRANEYIQTKIGPKPLQEPHSPIYLGSYSQRTCKDSKLC
jgi:hypothetical protein